MFIHMKNDAFNAVFKILFLNNIEVRTPGRYRRDIRNIANEILIWFSMEYSLLNSASTITIVNENIEISVIELNNNVVKLCFNE